MKKTLMDQIDKLEKDIKNLKIQGATNVALATIEGILLTLSQIDIGSKEEAYQKLKKIATCLAYARPTEPLAQNAVRFIFSQIEDDPSHYQRKAQKYKKMIANAKNKMMKAGSSLVKNGGKYFTHCHSSTVVSLFLEAKKMGKNFSVFATETRPLYQGRITAKELHQAGIDVTLIIDDVAAAVISGQSQKIDAVFIGADLLTDNGFVNKVGSFGIALSAQAYSIPSYCLSILLKYDPRTFSFDLIERRSPLEVWPDPPKGLKIYSPAFDFIPFSLGVKVQCENGILNGEKVAKEAQKVYTFLKDL